MFDEIKIGNNAYLIIEDIRNNNSSFVNNVKNNEFSMHKIKTCGIEYISNNDDPDIYKMILQYLSKNEKYCPDRIYAEFGRNIPMTLQDKIFRESLEGFALENEKGYVEGLLIKLN